MVPTIWPKLVTAFSRPSCTPRVPGSSLAIAQVAGQKAARARTSAIWPTSSIQKPCANIEPEPGGDGGDAGAEQDAPAADAVGIGAAHQVERRLGQRPAPRTGRRSRRSTGPANRRRAAPPARSSPGRDSRRARRGRRTGARTPDYRCAAVSWRPAFRPRPCAPLAWLTVLCRRNARAAAMHGRVGPGHRRAGRALYVRGLLQLPAGRPLALEPERASAPGTVVPLALHVDYWDYIGWKDPYAKREFSLRQRKLTQLQRMAFVYTPQVMLQGAISAAGAARPSMRPWRSINAQPAKASLKLAVLGAGSGRAGGRSVGRAWPRIRGCRALPGRLPEQARKPGEGGREPRPPAAPTTTWSWSGRARLPSPGRG